MKSGAADSSTKPILSNDSEPQAAGLPRIALTSGEPAGIGPDICLQLSDRALPTRLVCLGDPDLLAARRDMLGLATEIVCVASFDDARAHTAGQLQVLPVPLAETATAGQLNPNNAQAVLNMLDIATRACESGAADAIVTAPVQKSVINAAGIPFSGHTEYLADLTGTRRVVMLLAGQRLRVALATTHLPLAQVAAAIKADELGQTLAIMDADLRQRFGIARPRILVLGLNPHAGEDGVLGTEDRDIIRPAVQLARDNGIEVTGPVAADTAFTGDSLAHCDAVLAMYHDQGLPALKALEFGNIVNVTLGLPITRTSVDHGTALTLAGTGQAHHESLVKAIELALELNDNKP